MSQFAIKRFARGVKLTVEHQFDPLTSIVTAAETADIESTKEALGQSQVSWTIPWIGAGGVYGGEPALYLPWSVPPFQQQFDRATLNPPQYEVSLKEMSLSFDQRAEPLGVVGPSSAGFAGRLTNCDMSRYDMTLRLLERNPSVLSIDGTFPYGNTSTVREVFTAEISGVDAFGSGSGGVNVIRNNPVLIQDLRITLKPFAVYVWVLECPGLESADAGTIDVWTCTVGGAYVPGDTARLIISAVNYDYVVQLGDTNDTIAAAVAALASSSTTCAVYSDGATVVTVAYRAGPFAVTSLFLAGAGTFVAVNTTPGTTGTVERLMLPSLTLAATLVSPLTVRDNTSDFAANPGIQNIPQVHDGDRNGYAIPISYPIPGTTITGTEIQNANHGVERQLRLGAASGYGVGLGALANPLQASNAMPKELLKNDSHYHMIAVPLWGGQFRESLQGKDIPVAGLPFFAAPWDDPTMDRRVVPVPEGFVLHHAMAVWNCYAPQSPIYNRTPLDSAPPLNAAFTQEISISLNSGMRSDDYKQQQVAYLLVNPSAGAVPYEDWLIDQFDPFANGVTPPLPQAGYRLLTIPLVNDAVPWTGNTWHSSGLPFFMGKANNVTAPRSQCGNMPTAFAGAAFAAPVTAGRENVLEVRWSKQNSAIGLNGEQGATIIGQGCDWVLLCGKLTVGA